MSNTQQVPSVFKIINILYFVTQTYMKEPARGIAITTGVQYIGIAGIGNLWPWNLEGHRTT